MTVAVIIAPPPPSDTGPGDPWRYNSSGGAGTWRKAPCGQPGRLSRPPLH